MNSAQDNRAFMQSMLLSVGKGSTRHGARNRKSRIGSLLNRSRESSEPDEVLFLPQKTDDVSFAASVQELTNREPNFSPIVERIKVEILAILQDNVQWVLRSLRSLVGSEGSSDQMNSESDLRSQVLALLPKKQHRNG